MKQFLRRTATVLLTALMLSLTAVPAAANSAPVIEFDGAGAGASFAIDGDCPLEVAGEVLTFRIPSFPAVGGNVDSEDDFTADVSTVTAAYTFVNSTAGGVDARLVFPIGLMSGYVPLDYSAPRLMNGAVTTDGIAEASARLRCTYYPGDLSSFDAAKEVSRLSDDPVTGTLLAPDTPVYAYHFRWTGTPTERSAAVQLTFSFARGVFLNSDSVPSADRKGNSLECVCSYDLETLARGVTVWLIGGDGTDTQTARTLDPSGIRTEISGDGAILNIEGAAVHRTTEKTTLLASAARIAGDDLISAVDWYNAVSSLLEHEATMLAADPPLGHFYHGSCLLDMKVLYWMEYPLSVPAGGTVLNEVTVPVWPGYDNGYRPPLFKYTYLLSPAAAWASFGPLQIRIETPLYLQGTEAGVFGKTEGGYCLDLEGLPSGELTFTLCEAEKPSRRSSGGFAAVLMAVLAVAGTIVAGFLGIAAVIGGIVLLVILVRRAVRKAKNK